MPMRLFTACVHSRFTYSRAQIDFRALSWLRYYCSPLATLLADVRLSQAVASGLNKGHRMELARSQH